MPLFYSRGKTKSKRAKAKHVTEVVNRECGFLLEHFEQKSPFRKAEESTAREARKLRTLFGWQNRRNLAPAISQSLEKKDRAKN